MTSVAYRGNFQPDLAEPFTTEAHVAASLEEVGCEVVRIQEEREDWATTVQAALGCDLFLWTSTYSNAHKWPQDDAWAAVKMLNDRMPTAALHLDLFASLEREGMIRSEPWFYLRHCFTADGDHDALFAEAGVNHHFLPPAVFGKECYDGTPRDGASFPVAFIGSHEAYGHEEHWPSRKAVLDACRGRYGDQFKCWPERNRPAIRGRELNNVIASTKVLVGDSCFADRSVTYTSDRAFEHVGRGGFVVFPRIPWLAEQLIEGEHIAYYTPGDHGGMLDTVDYYLGHGVQRERIRKAGQAHVRAHHTYAERVKVLLAVLGY